MINKKSRLIIEAKSNPCVICNNSYPWYCMDFDHVSGKKISEVRKLSMLKAIEEIKKCRVICSNCHRSETYKNKQYCATGGGRKKKIFNSRLISVLLKTSLSSRDMSYYYNKVESNSISHTQFNRIRNILK